MRLYILPGSPRGIKVAALAIHLGLKPDLRVLDYFNKDQHDPEFAAINPNRRMPVLNDAGFILWESNAILHYLAMKKPESGLWPVDPKPQADILRWLFWDSSHWDAAWDIILSERVKKALFETRESGRRTLGRATTPGTPDAARIAEGEAYTQELATILNNRLKARGWLCDTGLSIADFAIGAWIPAATMVGFQINNYPNIARWYDSVERLRGWTEALAASPKLTPIDREIGRPH